jgi:hypothetical protein
MTDFTPLAGPVQKQVSYAPVQARVNTVYLAAFVFIGGALLAGFVPVALGYVAFAGWSPVPWYVVMAIGIAAIAGGLGYLIALIVRGFRKTPTVVDRLEAFAAANGLAYTAQGPAPDLPGAIFHSGLTRWTYGCLASTSGRFVEVGNLGYTVPAGRTTATETWGFVAMRLDRPLPHILLESTANDQNSTGALPVSVDRSQRLSLEGDFDKHFTLYAPADYEVDALYIFAPDLMALLIDEVGVSHVEIIDDWLFVYSPDDFTRLDAAGYEKLYRMIDLLQAKALRQTRAYEDERAAPLTVAAPGERMKPGKTQYARLYTLSAWAVGGMIVLFIAGAMTLYFASGAYWHDVIAGQ